MVPIKVDLVKKSKRPGYAMKPLYITIHDTANKSKGAGAEMHNRYVHNVAPNPSWHFSVDDKIVYQHLPLDENGWHASDGTNGTGNRKSIAIEICINGDGNLALAELNAAWLVAKLIKEVKTLKAFPACMKQHYDWSGKNCPAQIRARKNGWKDFLAAVESHLKAGDMPAITRAIGLEVDGKAVKEVGYLIDNATYVRAAYLIELTGGQVTGHGDHINIVLPTTPDQTELEELRAKLKKSESDISAIQAALAAERQRIENAKRALG